MYHSIIAEWGMRNVATYETEQLDGFARPVVSLPACFVGSFVHLRVIKSGERTK